jgi:hypothetical protein
MVMGKNRRSVKVGGETDPNPLADEIKNQNKHLTFFCFTVTVVCDEICVFLSSIFLTSFLRSRCCFDLFHCDFLLIL